jgi:hypothetical protein
MEYEAAQKAAKEAKAVKQQREDLADLMSNLITDKVKKIEGEQVEALEKQAEEAKGPAPWGSKDASPVRDIQKLMQQYRLTTGVTPNTLVVGGQVLSTTSPSFQQMTLFPAQEYIADKVFPKVTAPGTVTYKIERAPSWEEYEIKAELNVPERTNPILALSTQLARAKQGLIARLAGKNMKSRGDVEFAFELDEDGDMWVTARVLAEHV